MDVTTVNIVCEMPPIVVGTCSCCGGRVAVPGFVHVGRTDQTPACIDCGARALSLLHGPLVQTAVK